MGEVTIKDKNFSPKNNLSQSESNRTFNNTKSNLKNKKKKKWYFFYALYWIGLILILVSILTPWWSFSAQVENEEIEEPTDFEMGIKPTGGYVETPVGDLTNKLGPKVKAISILIALPLLLPLGFTFLDGLYTGGFRIISRRLYVTPLWSLVALINWMTYYYTISTALSEIGFDIPPTGSYTVEFEGYTFASASWGWGIGMYVAIIALILMIGSAFLMRKIRFKKVDIKRTENSLSITSIGFIFFGLISLLFGLLILALSSMLSKLAIFVEIPIFGGIFPIISAAIFFGMAVLSRKEYIKCKNCNNNIRMKKFTGNLKCDMCGYDYEGRSHRKSPPRKQIN